MVIQRAAVDSLMRTSTTLALGPEPTGAPPRAGVVPEQPTSRLGQYICTAGPVRSRVAVPVADALTRTIPWLWLVRISTDPFPPTRQVTALGYLSASLEGNAKGYKKSALAAVFLLNNYHYVLKYLKQPGVQVLTGSAAVSQYTELVALQTDAYQSRCVARAGAWRGAGARALTGSARPRQGRARSRRAAGKTSWTTCWR